MQYLLRTLSSIYSVLDDKGNALLGNIILHKLNGNLKTNQNLNI